MSNSIINIGLTGIKAHQSALSTTGNNITNVNTAGYSRQRVNLEAGLGQMTAAGYLGTGVNINNIERLNSQYISHQLRMDSSTFNQYSSLEGYLSQVDSLLGNSSTGLSKAMNSFFNSLHMAADDPTSVPTRDLVIAEAEALTTRFRSLHGQLNQIGTSVEQEMTSLVPQINSLSQGIAELNVAIVTAGGGTPNQQPNDLLDKRDEMIRQLSELVSVSVVDPGDGTLNVFIGKGQSLVMGNRANQLGLVQSQADPTRQDIAITQNGTPSVITSEVSGGKLGGVLAFRETVLQDSINSLGRIALGIAEAVNQQHHLGVDLEGALGKDFFGDINSRTAQLSRVSAHRANSPDSTGVLAVAISDPAALTNENYEVRFVDGNRFEIVSASGMAKGGGTVPDTIDEDHPLEVTLDGMTLRFEQGSFQPGDRFLVTPTRNGARDISVALKRPEEVALASPIRASAGENNTGSATISQGNVFDTSTAMFADQPGQLSPPLAVQFVAGDRYQVVNANTGAVLRTEDYIPGERIDLFSADPAAPGNAAYTGFQFSISGTPNVGDTFSIGYNASGVSDNRNALALAALETKGSSIGGNMSFSEAYTFTVQTVGTATSQTRVNSETAHSLLQQSESRWQSLSGVNLDEEAGKLIQFQAAYNASAKVVGIARELFDTLISTFR